MAKIIIGIDEVGRGALCGPVVACALYTTLGEMNITDSKKMSQKRRNAIFSFLQKSNKCEWAIGRVSEKIIDEINILNATKMAMQKAVFSLEKKIGVVDLLLIDGNFGIESRINQKSIIRGDEMIFQIKLASIIAKVSRDKIMMNYHQQYPKYSFDRNKGYGTFFHRSMLSKIGPCKIHRNSFAPLKYLQK